MKLKPKHYLFIAHIIRGESATQAAINAGFSEKLHELKGLD